MSAAAVRETDVFPDATEMTVAEAYDSIVVLMEPGIRYSIDWHTVPCDECVCEHILNRFSRQLHYEADLIAVPLTEDGHRLRSALAIVCAIKFPYIEPDDKSAVQQRLRDELDAVRADKEVLA